MRICRICTRNMASYTAVRIFRSGYLDVRVEFSIQNRCLFGNYRVMRTCDPLYNTRDTASFFRAERVRAISGKPKRTARRALCKIGKLHRRIRIYDRAFSRHTYVGSNLFGLYTISTDITFSADSDSCISLPRIDISYMQKRLAKMPHRTFSLRYDRDSLVRT